MKALENINRINYQNEAVMKLIRLYQYKGKEFYYRNILKADYASISKSTVAKEAWFFAHILGLQISDNRMRLIINKGSKPKSKDEEILTNLKFIFETSINRAEDFELHTNGILSLAKRLYNNVKVIKYETRQVEYQNNLLIEIRNKSKRDDVQEILNRYIDLLSTGEYELVSLVINFYIDFIHIKPFKEESDMVGLLLIYVLLFRQHFDVSTYEPFFEYIYANYAQFKDLVIKANYNYESGYPHTEPLTDFIINSFLESYDKLENLIRDYEFDSKLNKSDNIENTINRVPQIFTKEDIRIRHPYVSDSTINRTLQRLRDEGKISALGTGRSAKWMRVTEAPERFNPYEQLDIFGLDNETE